MYNLLISTGNTTAYLIYQCKYYIPCDWLKSEGAVSGDNTVIIIVIIISSSIGVI